VNITDEAIDAAVEAQWNAIPCHVPWSEYIAKHPHSEQIKMRVREYMRCALKAALKEMKL